MKAHDNHFGSFPRQFGCRRAGFQTY